MRIVALTVKKDGVLAREQLYRRKFEQFVSEHTCIPYQADRSERLKYVGR